MSVPEPDLRNDPAEYQPRPLLGLGFWALVAFGFLCVLAGAGVALLGPGLTPVKPATPPATTLSRIDDPFDDPREQTTSVNGSWPDQIGLIPPSRPTTLQIGSTQVQARVPGQEPP